MGAKATKCMCLDGGEDEDPSKLFDQAVAEVHESHTHTPVGRATARVKIVAGENAGKKGFLEDFSARDCQWNVQLEGGPVECFGGDSLELVPEPGQAAGIAMGADQTLQVGDVLTFRPSVVKTSFVARLGLANFGPRIAYTFRASVPESYSVHEQQGFLNQGQALTVEVTTTEPEACGDDNFVLTWTVERTRKQPLTQDEWQQLGKADVHSIRLGASMDGQLLNPPDFALYEAKTHGAHWECGQCSGKGSTGWMFSTTCPKCHGHGQDHPCGSTMVRGPDWTGGTMDGGGAYAGKCSGGIQDGQAFVIWPHGDGHWYRCGRDGKHEVSNQEDFRVGDAVQLRDPSKSSSWFRGIVSQGHPVKAIKDGELPKVSREWPEVRKKLLPVEIKQHH